MIQFKVKPITEWRNETIFINPKCGHPQKFEYATPVRCQDHLCLELVPQIDKLFGIKNQENRVKFFAEGKI